jgi:chromatin remodeling complex protein RSC6
MSDINTHIDNIIYNINIIIKNIYDEIESQTVHKKEPDIKLLKNIIKELKNIQIKTKKIISIKRPYNKKIGAETAFTKKIPISPQLAEFLNIPESTLISRIECTKKIHQYIKENNLINPEYKREIKPDKKLTTLLDYNKASIESGGHGNLYYTTLQKLIQKHFI